MKAASVCGRAICKNQFSHRTTFRNYKWGQIVNFEAMITNEMFIYVFFEDPNTDLWPANIDMADFISNFVIEDGFKSKGEINEGSPTYRALKNSLNLP